MDDSGLPPPSIRSWLLATEGPWRLILEKPSDRLRALLRTEQLLGTEHFDAKKEVKTADPSLLYAGTRAEAEWIAAHLAHEGIHTLVGKTPSL